MFATPDDLRKRWSGAPADDGQVTAIIEDASAWLSALYDIPASPGEKLAGVLRLVVCSMAKRSLLSAENDHLDSLAQSAGVFGETRSFRNSEGNLFLTKAERDLLDAALAQDAGKQRGMRTVEAKGW